MHDPVDTYPPRPTALERILGERPLGLVVRLVVLSTIVGFGMQVFGFDAAGLLRAFVATVQDAFLDSTGLFRSIGSYMLTGAAVVVPLWFVFRVLRR